MQRKRRQAGANAALMIRVVPEFIAICKPVLAGAEKGLTLQPIKLPQASDLTTAKSIVRDDKTRIGN